MNDSRRIRPTRILLCLAVCVLGWAHGIHARPLTQYAHRSFEAGDGVPNEITSIAQTADGMLWLGSQGGIYTFDGVHFARQSITYPGGPHKAYFMRGDAHGGLWIGWRYGGITHIDGGTVRHFNLADGLARGTVWGFAFDHAGNVWAAGVGGIMRYDGKRWRHLGPADGFTATAAAAVTVDGAGTVGVFTEQGLFLLAKGAHRFAPPIGKTATRQPPAFGPNGEIYFMEARGIRRIASLARYDQDDYPWLYRETGETGSFVADRSGGLWFDSTNGLHRIEHPDEQMAVRRQFRPDTETRTRADGLSGKISYFQFEDAQGNVWISTEGGLDRFRPVDLVEVRPHADPPVLDNPHLVPAREGGMWVQTFFPRSALQRVQADGTISERLWVDTTPLLPTAEGVIYMAADRRLALRHDGVSRPITPPVPPGRPVHLARQRDGTLWVSLMPKGIWRLGPEGWQRETRLPDDTSRAIFAGSDGAMWFGFDNEGVFRLSGAGVARLGPAQGLTVGRVSAFTETAGALWIAGNQGLNILRHGKPEKARPRTPEAFDGLTDMLPDAAGGMWLTGGAGLLYLSPAAVAGCMKTCAEPVQPRLFDATDGLRNRSTWAGYNQLGFDARGRLWTATSAAVYWLDPARLPARAAAPRPRIVATSAWKGPGPHAARVTLAPPERDLVVEYTAPVLDMPERARFRYRLQGYDSAWREAGSRREAMYTGLPPGRYVFEVAAAKHDSAWSAATATLVVTVTPAWYETWWFRLLCAALTLALAAALYRWRLRAAARRARVEADARHVERELIARDLHDTLLQTNYSLLLRLRAIRQAAGGPLAQQLGDVLADALDTLNQGRDKVAGLRAGVRCPDLADALRPVVHELAAGTALNVEWTTSGAPWPLAPAAMAETTAIVAEAVRNVVKHADARTLRITIAYRWLRLTVTIADDGRGIPAAYVRGRDRHWGVTGMIERARSIGARLAVEGLERGTLVRLRLWRWRSRAAQRAAQGTPP